MPWRRNRELGSSIAALQIYKILQRAITWQKIMVLQIIEANTKKSIKAISLHQQRNRWLRMDAVPFSILYLLPLAYFKYSSSRFPKLIALSCEALLLLAHVMIFLMQQWSKSFQCWVGYTRVNIIEEATHVLAVPLPHCGTAAICPISVEKSSVANGKLQHSFEFQRLMYRYFDQLLLGKAAAAVPGATTTISAAPSTSPSNICGFTRLEYPTSNLVNDYRSSKGVNSASYKTSYNYYGPNIIELPIPPFLDLFFEHLLAPFFVFQVFCVALWMLDEYWYYSLFTLAMLLVFESTVCYTRVRTMKNLRKKTKTPPNVYVYRERKWSKAPVSSVTLVPGDIVSLRVPSDLESTVPCDALLLRGSLVVNEAMLTGESVPLMKEPVEGSMGGGGGGGGERLQFTDGTDKRHQKNIVYCGTQILKQESTSE